MRPRCTYRLQLREEFDFDDAAGVAAYLSALGVSHAYCSPYLQAAPGSTHGYDVVDHSAISAELGGSAGHDRFVAALRAHGLGQVVDVVPNHMARDGRQNEWWWDVLENGPRSPFASYFDIDWGSSGESGSTTPQVLVPILASRYGTVVESGELQLGRDGGSLFVRYQDAELPLSPASLDELLESAADAAISSELAELARALAKLPEVATGRLDATERHRDKVRLCNQLAAICDADPEVGAAIDHQLEVVASDPDALDHLLQRQHYRLAYWGIASEELDYRRFLNIDSLVGLRVEDDEVFAATHQLVFDMVRRGEVDGLRVDHVDGLFDPEAYLHRLRRAAGDVWLVVEKVLQDDEQLPATWPIEGTTGYDFLSRTNALFVDTGGAAAFIECYEDFLGETARYAEVVRQARTEVARGELEAEVERLTALLAEVCDGRRSQRDRTRRELHDAIVELVVAFRVYRTYVAPGRPVTRGDRDRVEAAVAAARGAGTDLDDDLLDFVADLLLLEQPGGPETAFALGFQQLCAPVAAKGVEDTAFYRYFRLSSLNEVGCDPGTFGSPASAYHEAAARAGADWPATMLTLGTHDSKRSADVRARLNVLSELPEDWRSLLSDLDRVAARFRTALLDRNTEYLFVQTILGAWPLDVERAVEYLRKASREAKVRTSWSAPDAAYDAALEGFVRAALADADYRATIERFLERTELVALGRRTSLAQTALLLTSPGVPDLYQGSELWDLSLVDPDNRRPVDYDRRAQLLASLGETPPSVPLADDDEGVTKLWLTARLFAHRRRNAALYETPHYEPLACEGPRAAHVVAFRRNRLLVVVPRLVASLADGWGATSLEFPDGTWQHVLGAGACSGETSLESLLGSFPVAVLEGPPLEPDS